MFQNNVTILVFKTMLINAFKLFLGYRLFLPTDGKDEYRLNKSWANFFKFLK